MIQQARRILQRAPKVGLQDLKQRRCAQKRVHGWFTASNVVHFAKQSFVQAQHAQTARVGGHHLKQRRRRRCVRRDVQLAQLPVRSASSAAQQRFSLD
jgi:hypothetical protein